MKKKLLFVIPSLCVGGGEKSLVNLLNQIDYDLYEVDLFLFSKTGIFINLLPKQVNILELPNLYEEFTKNFNESLKLFILKLRLDLVFSRIMFTIKNKFIKNTSKAEQYTWKYISKSIHKFEKEYDVAIGYLEKSSVYFVVDKVKSKNKIGWVHTNYSDSGMDSNFDTPYFENLDTIITVSNECAKSLEEIFPNLKDKIHVIHNIVSPKLINSLSKNKIGSDFIKDNGYTNIITVARLSYEKGIDIAVNTCKLLVDKGYKIRWYVLGEGPERDKLEELICNYGIENEFRLLGAKENPYPYIKESDIYVQPSRYEGKSIAIDEAKIMHKPIIITNYETSKDQIDDGKNGIIAEINEGSICEAIKNISKDTRLQNKLRDELSKEKLGTEDEIYELYNLFC